jgi:hypothetical protein
MHENRPFLMCAAALLAVIGVLGGCIAHDSPAPKAPQVVLSGDGLCQVSIPSSWSKQADLHAEAELQVGDHRNKCYLIVLSEPKADFDKIDYHRHSELTRASILATLKDGRVTAGPIELEIGGRKAVQYEIQGIIDDMKLIYLHTTVDGRRRFHQVLGWTLPSKIEEHRGNLESVINSFEEK